MSEENQQKRIKFSDDKVDFYEKVFMLEHDRAMGYSTRQPRSSTDTTSAISNPSLKRQMRRFLYHSIFMKHFVCGTLLDMSVL